MNEGQSQEQGNPSQVEIQRTWQEEKKQVVWWTVESLRNVNVVHQTLSMFSRCCWPGIALLSHQECNAIAFFVSSSCSVRYLSSLCLFTYKSNSQTCLPVKGINDLPGSQCSHVDWDQDPDHKKQLVVLDYLLVLICLQVDSVELCVRTSGFHFITREGRRKSEWETVSWINACLLLPDTRWQCWQT